MERNEKYNIWLWKVGSQYFLFLLNVQRKRKSIFLQAQKYESPDYEWCRLFLFFFRIIMTLKFCFHVCIFLFFFFSSSSCCRNNKGILGIPQSFLVPNLLNNQSDFLKFLLRHDFVQDKLDSKCVLKIVDETRYGVLRCRNWKLTNKILLRLNYVRLLSNYFKNYGS